VLKGGVGGQFTTHHRSLNNTLFNPKRCNYNLVLKVVMAMTLTILFSFMVDIQQAKDIIFSYLLTYSWS
jgi:hypothetical protein